MEHDDDDDDDPLIHWWMNQNANNNPKHQHVFWSQMDFPCLVKQLFSLLQRKTPRNPRDL